MKSHCQMLQTDEIQVVVGDASRDGMGGTQYAGLWSLASKHRQFNAFGNSFAGLLPGPVRGRAPEIECVDDSTCALVRRADAAYPVDVRAAYKIVAPYYVDHSLVFTDRKDARGPGCDFREVSWCCYTNCPDDPRLHFLSGGKWFRYISPKHGIGSNIAPAYLNRYSIGVRDVLKARAAAFEQDGVKAVIVSCDLAGVTPEIARKIRQLVAKNSGIPAGNIMVHCTHTHSGPNTGVYTGWGNEDDPYIVLLPGRIAGACAGALARLQDADMRHAVVACEGIGLNREYDQDAPPLEDVLRNGWRPAKPELTDTKCQVLKFVDRQTGQMLGFMAYFGCHPVVCCQLTRYIHGDFCGVAMNNLEREYPGAVGLFLQGAQGDVNSCVVHKPEQQSLLALDIIAARFANSVRNGLRIAKPVAVTKLKCADMLYNFSSRDIPLRRIKEMLAEQESVVYADGASDANEAVRMSVVTMMALRSIICRLEKGDDLMTQTGEIHGIRLGPVEFLGAPFEIMQAIKNDVVATARAPVTLVMSVTNGAMGYAPDRIVAARRGYASDTVPMIVGRMPFRDIHSELVKAFLDMDRILFEASVNTNS